AVIKCAGNLIDSASHTYLHHTTRETFWKNKDAAKVHVELRNADTDSSSFNTAYKGFASFEAKLDIATSTPNVFEVGGKTGTPITGTITGSNNVKLLQLYSNRM